MESRTPQTMRMESLKAGFVQFDIRLGDLSANLETAAGLLRRLGDAGVGLAVLPEMWSCGFDNRNLAEHGRRTPEILDGLSEIAARYGMLIAGSLPEPADEGVYNTLYLTDADGSLAGAYRKVHLFSVTGEDRHFLAGDRNVVCDTAIGPVGLLICYDLRFPEICRALCLKGARVVVIPAQWPGIRISRWDILAQARAIENQLYVVAANRCGRDHGIQYGGHSIIVDPAGEVLEWAGDGSETGIAEIDFQKMAKVREQMPSLRERAPDAYDS